MKLLSLFSLALSILLSCGCLRHTVSYPLRLHVSIKKTPSIMQSQSFFFFFFFLQNIIGLSLFCNSFLCCEYSLNNNSQKCWTGEKMVVVVVYFCVHMEFNLDLQLFACFGKMLAGWHVKGHSSSVPTVHGGYWAEAVACPRFYRTSSMRLFSSVEQKVKEEEEEDQNQRASLASSFQAKESRERNWWLMMIKASEFLPKYLE